MCIKNLSNEILSLINKAESHSEYAELLENFPHLKGETVFNALTNTPELILSDYSTLWQVKNELKDLFVKTHNNYAKSSTSRINNRIKSFLNLKEDKCLKIDTVHFDGEKADLDLIVDFIQDCGKLIPYELRKNIVLNFLITNNPIDPFSSFDATSNNIVLSSGQEGEKFAAQMVHELGHIIEMNNPEVLKRSIDFLKSRSPKWELRDLAAFSLETDVNIDVIPGKFIDPYVGRIYGDLDKVAGTEVISVGLQSLFLDPVAFLFKDTDHFLLIYDLLKGRNE